jgi:hypothetical protein
MMAASRLIISEGDAILIWSMACRPPVERLFLDQTEGPYHT